MHAFTDGQPENILVGNASNTNNYRRRHKNRTPTVRKVALLRESTTRERIHYSGKSEGKVGVQKQSVLYALKAVVTVALCSHSVVRPHTQRVVLVTFQLLTQAQ